MERIRLLLLGLLFSSITFGQTIKVQYGTTLSSLDWNDGMIFNKTLLGYSVFTGVDYADNKFYNFSTNIGLIRKGGKDEIMLMNEFGESLGNINGKITLDYITVNTTFDLKFPIHDKLLPYISFGPRLDYLIGYSKEFDGFDALKKYNKGLILGGGIRYCISNIQIGIRADYYLNFDTIAYWSAQTNNLGGNIDDKTFTVNMTLGYKFK